MPFYRFDVEVYASTYGVVEAANEEEAQELIMGSMPSEPNLCHCCAQTLDIGAVADYDGSRYSLTEIDEYEYETLRHQLY